MDRNCLRKTTIPGFRIMATRLGQLLIACIQIERVLSFEIGKVIGIVIRRILVRLIVQMRREVFLAAEPSQKLREISGGNLLDRQR